MSALTTALMIVQVLSALAIIVLVLLQQGKGADMGSSFGSGSAGSLFGAVGAANFLSRTTKWAAVVFFIATLGMAYMSHSFKPAVEEGDVMKGATPAASDTAPAIPGTVTPAPAPAAPAPDATVPSVPAAPQK